MFDDFSHNNVAPVTILSYINSNAVLFMMYAKGAITSPPVNTPCCVMCSKIYFYMLTLANNKPLSTECLQFFFGN